MVVLEASYSMWPGFSNKIPFERYFLLVGLDCLLTGSCKFFDS